MTIIVATWQPVGDTGSPAAAGGPSARGAISRQAACDTIGGPSAGDAGPAAFTAHLHGRELAVDRDPGRHCWHWRVVSEHGSVLAEGDQRDRLAAEAAAEDEATAVHPPTASLLERLLT